MKVYAVGGAIRDAVMGMPVNDVDYVVVGASAEQMVALGYRPVGKDFPVFLHPQTQAEYALARTERKTSKGYHGFHFYADPSVTLEQDLERRDLTMNAIAQQVDASGDLTGPLIDPYGGLDDIKAKIFRHVSSAFAEDPLRLLRVARFAARFPDFTIAPETQEALKAIVASEELSTLSSERVWQELSRGMGSAFPLRMTEVLLEVGAAPLFLPHDLIKVLENEDRKLKLNQAIGLLDFRDEHRIEQVCALLLASLSEQSILEWAQAIRMPNGVRDFTQLFARLNQMLMKGNAKPADLLEWFNRADAWRKPERAQHLIALANRLGLNAGQIADALHAAQGVNSQALIQALSEAHRSNGDRIRSAIDAARLAAIQACLQHSDQ